MMMTPRGPEKPGRHSNQHSVLSYFVVLRCSVESQLAQWDLHFVSFFKKTLIKAENCEF